MIPRVVLDSNIVVSALLFGGKPWEIIRLSLQGGIKLFSSPALLGELSKVLLEKFNYDPVQVGVVLDLYKDAVSLVYPQKTIQKIKADPADNRTLEAAVESESRFIITGDKHLLGLGDYKGVKILKPTEFLSAFA